MLKNKLGVGYSVAAVTDAAFHYGVFDAILEYLENHRFHGPSIAVIPINLRGFSVPWITGPYWQFVLETEVLRHEQEWGYRYFLKPLFLYKVIDPNPISATKSSEAVSPGTRPHRRAAGSRGRTRGSSGGVRRRLSL